MVQPSGFSILTTRLRLRPLQPADLDVLAEIYLHPDVARWIGPHTKQDVADSRAIVEFPGVPYRGGAEQKSRKYLIDNNYVDTVIQLPPDLFFGTTIATCVIVLKKSKADNQTLFIDASAEFVRSGNKNKLTEANQARILEAFTDRSDGDHFAKLVDNSEIAENSYNIAVSSYVEAEDTREVVDIKALNAEIARIVERHSELRSQIDMVVADLDGGDAGLWLSTDRDRRIHPQVTRSPEFLSRAATVVRRCRRRSHRLPESS